MDTSTNARSQSATTSCSGSFTPGPWHHEKAGPDADHVNVWVRGGIGHVAAVSKGLLPDPTAEANARLIAAAPSMLEALQKIAANPGWQDNEVGFMSGHIAVAAIREALGQNAALSRPESPEGANV